MITHVRFLIFNVTTFQKFNIPLKVLSSDLRDLQLSSRIVYSNFKTL